MWNIAERVRGRHTSLAALLTAAQEEGLFPTWRTITQLNDRGVVGSMTTESTSEQVVDFLSSLVGSDPDTRILDPWAETGLLLAGVAEAGGFTSVHGLINGPGKEPVAKYLLPNADWTVGDPLIGLETLGSQEASFDLIVCAPPWGTRFISSALDTEPDKRVAKLTLDQQLVLASCQLLRESGRALFLLPNAFLLNPEAGIRSIFEGARTARVERHHPSSLLDGDHVLDRKSCRDQKHPLRRRLRWQGILGLLQ